MNRSFLLMMIFGWLVSCKPPPSEQIIGVWKNVEFRLQDGASKREIVFPEDEFWVISADSIYIIMDSCCVKAASEIKITNDSIYFDYKGIKINRHYEISESTLKLDSKSDLVNMSSQNKLQKTTIQKDRFETLIANSIDWDCFQKKWYYDGYQPKIIYQSDPDVPIKFEPIKCIDLTVSNKDNYTVDKDVLTYIQDSITYQYQYYVLRGQLGLIPTSQCHCDDLLINYITK